MHLLTQFDFHHRIGETRGTALVLFTAPACGSCRRLKAVLAQAPEPFAGLSLFEVDAQHDMGLSREFGVFHLPAMFLFVDGEFHGELHSEAHPERLLAAIAQLLGQPAQEAP